MSNRHERGQTAAPAGADWHSLKFLTLGGA